MMISSAADSSRGNIKQGNSSSLSSNEGRVYGKRKRNGAANGFIRSIRSTNREQKLNVKKFRIRNLAENPDEDTKSLVIETLSSTLEILLTSDDIISCERVNRWDGTETPRDIVVTFEQLITREQVFSRQFSNQGLPFQMVDELCQERAEIWKQAVYFFGAEDVRIGRGAVYANTDKKQKFRKIRTLWEFRTVIRKLKKEMKLVPFALLRSDSSVESLYSSESSEEVSFSYYGSDSEKDRLKKTVRIRRVPEIPGENTMYEVLQYMSLNLSLEFDDSDIDRCERVPGWDGCVDPRDILLSFKFRHLQKCLLFNRSLMENGKTMILEELPKEMAEVWVDAVENFGEHNVNIMGSQVIIYFRGRNRVIDSMADYRNYVEKIESSLRAIYCPKNI